MSDYKQSGNRWTAIYLVQRLKGDNYVYKKLPFELVRFNVDTHPDALEEIVPCGEDVLNPSGNKQDSDKIYEKIWIVDALPWKEKVSFGKPE